MAPSPRPRRSSLVLVGGVFLGAGVLIGQWLPRWGGEPAPVWTGAGPQADPAVSQPEPVGVPTLAPVVDKVAGGVVTVRGVLPVEADTAGPSDGGDPPAGSAGVLNGTGFVVHGKGLVVTSRHLVAQAMLVVVDVPEHGPRYADVVGEDPVTDLAVLRLQDPPAGLPVLELGASESLRAGDWIVTVGNPFDYPLTVTAGVVSFVGRHLRHYDFGVTNDFLQFSAPVNPGSSGGPVLDLHGRVVGVTTQAAVSAQGISFAIPSRTLKWVLDRLDRSEDGRVHRGYLGIGFEARSERDDYGRRSPGALITEVSPGQPADLAGLQAGDVVLYCNDEAVRGPGDLHEFVTRSEPGTEIRLTVLRDGKILEPIVAEVGEVGAAADKPTDF